MQVATNFGAPIYNWENVNGIVTGTSSTLTLQDPGSSGIYWRTYRVIADPNPAP